MGIPNTYSTHKVWLEDFGRLGFNTSTHFFQAKDTRNQSWGEKKLTYHHPPTPFSSLNGLFRGHYIINPNFMYNKKKVEILLNHSIPCLLLFISPKWVWEISGYSWFTICSFLLMWPLNECSFLLLFCSFHPGYSWFVLENHPKRPKQVKLWKGRREPVSDLLEPSWGWHASQINADGLEDV